MKDFFKFLGIISLALVIGFSMAGCKTDDDDGGGGGGGSGSVVEWPDDIVFGTSVLGNKKGNYTSGTNQMDIYNSVSGTAQACSIGNVLFVIKEVSGKKITVNDYSADVVFCTDYTVTATTLTLTGGEGAFAQYSGITWTKK